MTLENTTGADICIKVFDWVESAKTKPKRNTKTQKIQKLNPTPS
jgi:hypothetical protein